MQLNSTQAAQLAVAAMKALDDAAAQDDGEAIAELEAIAESAARKSGDADLSKQFATRHKQLKTIRDEADRIKPFRDKLAANAADPTANLEVGKHYCFAQRDWKTGLPMLVKGSDAALKEAADADLASPTTASAKLKVADLWWDLSEKEPEGSYSRDSLRQRAAFWYRDVAPALTGLAHLSSRETRGRRCRIGSRRLLLGWLIRNHRAAYPFRLQQCAACGWSDWHRAKLRPTKRLNRRKSPASRWATNLFTPCPTMAA